LDQHVESPFIGRIVGKRNTFMVREPVLCSGLATVDTEPNATLTSEENSILGAA
jgi:hypothetical protein